MKTTLSLRSRRSSKRIQENFRHFIAFPLAKDWFAFPIETVVKVIPLGTIYGESQHQGIGLTTYQDQEMIVINLAKFLGENNLSLTAFTVPYLMIIQFENAIAGLSLNSSPKVHRVTDSSLVPLPDVYLANQNFQFFEGNMIKLEHHSPILILDAQKIGSFLEISL